MTFLILYLCGKKVISNVQPCLRGAIKIEIPVKYGIHELIDPKFIYLFYSQNFPFFVLAHAGPANMI